MYHYAKALADALRKLRGVGIVAVGDRLPDGAGDFRCDKLLWITRRVIHSRRAYI